MCCRKKSDKAAKRQSYQVQLTHKIQIFLPQVGILSIALSSAQHRYTGMHVPQPCMCAEGAGGKRGRTCAGELRAHGVAGGAVVAQQREGRPQRHCATQLRVARLQHPAQRAPVAASSSTQVITICQAVSVLLYVTLVAVKEEDHVCLIWALEVQAYRLLAHGCPSTP